MAKGSGPLRVWRTSGSVWAVVAVVVLLYGCELGQYTQTQETPEFVVSLTLDPYPSPAGTQVKAYATLRENRQGVTGCRVRLQSREAGPEGAAPDEAAWLEAAEQGRIGIYTHQAVFFRNGGDWELLAGVRCRGREHVLVFHYSVEPPDDGPGSPN